MLPLDQLPLLSGVPELAQVISTRAGGVSDGPYASLNVGYHVGDEAARVTENRRRLAAAAGYLAGDLVAGQQVHGTAIARVGLAECGRGAFSWEEALPDTDGFIVAAVGVPVAIQVADCAPVLLVDPRRHVLALLHAGWRGALGRVASQAAAQMIEHAGTDPRDLLVGIGPALCPHCLEVGEEIGTAVAAEFGPGALITGGGKPHLNLAAMLTADLASLGVTAAQITQHPHCTRCHNDRFFSHRGQDGCAGRLAMVAWWQS